MQIQVQKEMQKESAKHAGYKAKVPLRGVAVKKNSTQMVFQRFKKQFLQHLRRRFWMPSNTSDPIRKMHTNKKRKATIKKMQRWLKMHTTKKVHWHFTPISAPLAPS